MVYEVISPRGRGTGTIIGVHTESAQCIDSLDMQKAMVAGGSKITFEGTTEEYEAVKDMFIFMCAASDAIAAYIAAGG